MAISEFNRADPDPGPVVGGPDSDPDPGRADSDPGPGRADSDSDPDAGPGRVALDASLSAWRAAGVDAAVGTWHDVIGAPDAPLDAPARPPGVEAVTVIPGLRRVECLVSDAVDYQDLWASLRRLTSAEWTACVITALGRMGTAQEQLRGTPVQLQGWWQDRGSVHFTEDQAC